MATIDLTRDGCEWVAWERLNVGSGKRQTYSGGGNVAAGQVLRLVPDFDPSNFEIKWMVVTRISDEWCDDEDGCE